MLVERDLGFSSLWVVVVLLLAQVIGTIIIRRKWRFEVARREEVKRLMDLAAEEAARAELESTSQYAYSYGYGYKLAPEVAVPESASRRPQYQCAVCLSPATTRCAQCKSVRYCSGKCQIVHWRQGHREECHPFTDLHQMKGIGIDFSQKVTKEEESKRNSLNFLSGVRQYPEVSENLSEQPLVFDLPQSEVSHSLSEETLPSTSPKSTKNAFVVGISPSHFSVNSPAAASTNHTDLYDEMDGQQQAYVSTGKVVADFDDMVHVKSLASVAVTSSIRIRQPGSDNQVKPSSNSKGTCCGSSNTSSSISDDSDSPIAERPMPSSGFWGGTLRSQRPKNDTLDDSAHLSSNIVADCDISSSRSSSSLNLAKEDIPSLAVRRSSDKRAIPNANQSGVAGTKKTTAALLDETDLDAIKHGKLPALSPSVSDSVAADHSCSEKLKSKIDDHSVLSAPSVHRSVCATRCSLVKDDGKNCSSYASIKEGMDFAIHGANNLVHLHNIGKVSSLSCSSSDAHLSLRKEMHTIQEAKSIGVCSSAGRVSHLGNGSINLRHGLKSSGGEVGDRFGASKQLPNSFWEAENEAMQWFNGKELFSYKRFVELYNWKKLELRPRGLTNCGNSCYANAVLQCLVFTPPLTTYLVQGYHSKSCKRKERCFVCELEILVLNAKEGQSPLSPIRILSQLRNCGSGLGNGREEDAHEFLRCAIDTMQAVCLQGAGVCAPNMLEEETTLVGLIFGGYLKSKIRCMKCGVKSERHERMMDLTVEIEGNIGTLEEALVQFTDTEILDGENKYRCSRCKSYEKAKKRLTILEAPNVLTIALKRFQSGKFGKLNKSVHFPEILDMAPFISRTSDKSPIYQLYGVVVHLDIMNATYTGHYVCYVKNNQNKWFKIDDSSVKSVELATVLEKGAYMLFYARCSPRAPQLLRKLLSSREPKMPATSIPKFGSNVSTPRVPVVPDSSIGQCRHEQVCNKQSNFQSRRIWEDDSFSDNSSSLFSETCSCSTDSSSRDITSIEDGFDQTFSDIGHGWSSLRRSPSDSDTSSSSSSPSPLHLRCSGGADVDPFFPRCPETHGTKGDNRESGLDCDGLWARTGHKTCRLENSEGNRGFSFSCSDSAKQCGMLASDSCSKTNCSSRVEQAAHSFDHPDECFGRSGRNRTY